MALQTVAGGGMYLPNLPGNLLIPPAMNTTVAVMDASAEKLAFCGRFWHKDRVSKTVTKVHVKLGTVSVNAASALQLSLQGCSLSTAPLQPDGVVGETATISGADAAFVTGAWFSATLSAGRVVAPGELLSAVLEYTTFTTSDSVSLAMWLASGAVHIAGSCAAVLYNGTSWSLLTQSNPNVLFECSDGSFGTIEGGFPVNGITTGLYNFGSSPFDETALQFSVPFPCRVDGAWIVMSASGGSGANWEFVLYDSSGTALETVTVDSSAMSNTIARWIMLPFSQEVTLTAGATYRLAMKSTNGTNITIYYFDMSSATHLQAHGGGTAFYWAHRQDLGSWSTVTNRRPFMGVRISAIDDGVGGGSGAILSRVRLGL